MVVGVGQHHGDAACGGDPGGLQLGGHPAGAHGGADPGGVDLQVVHVGHLGDPLRARFRRVPGVEGVHVREQHQRVGPHQVGDQCGQPVVVAEPDLVRGDGVVLVDHGDGAELEQPGEGAQRVAVVGLAGEVVDGEQHLADHQRVRGEQGVVALDQQPLTHGRRRLLTGQVAGPMPHAERGHAGRDRAGGDQDDVAPGLPEPGQGADQLVHPVGVQPAASGQRRRADLDHDPLGVRDPLPAAHRSSSSSTGSADTSSWPA